MTPSLGRTIIALVWAMVITVPLLILLSDLLTLKDGQRVLLWLSIFGASYALTTIAVNTTPAS